MTIEAAKIDRLVQAYEAGHDTAEAAALAGISRRSADRLRRDNEAVAQRIETAIATWVDECLGQIGLARVKDYRAAAWLLERSPHTRDRYGQRTPEDAGEAAAAVLAALTASYTQRVTVSDAPELPALPASDTPSDRDPDASE